MKTVSNFCNRQTKRNIINVSGNSAFFPFILFIALLLSSCSKSTVMVSTSEKQLPVMEEATKIEVPLNEEISDKQKRKTEKAIQRSKGNFPLTSTVRNGQN
jgi:hypothetical protein